MPQRYKLYCFIEKYKYGVNQEGEADVYCICLDKNGNDCTIDLVPINNIENELDIVFYPNPNNGKFWIANNEMETEMYINVYDVSGKTKHKVRVDKNTKFIDLTFLSKGVYYYAISSKENTLLKNGKIVRK